MIKSVDAGPIFSYGIKAHNEMFNLFHIILYIIYNRTSKHNSKCKPQEVNTQWH